jgi:hypothetical protein
MAHSDEIAYRLRSQLAELITDPAAYLYVKPIESLTQKRVARHPIA